MSIATIQAKEYPIRKIFCNDFVFRIPLYQRPYSWTTEQAGELLADLLEFIGEDSTPIDNLSPYFLGSTVLIKNDGSPDAEVVDGQQRLTTLTILLATLRTLVNPDHAASLTKYLYEKGDLIEGNPNRYRLTLRERDADFFRTYIQVDGQIEKLKTLDKGQLSDSCRNILLNALLYLKVLSELPEPQRVRLAKFIVMQCLMVVVSTHDLDSAYRIFSILNDRGMDLSHSDILKAEIIGKIPVAEQDTYNDQWEDVEDELGRDVFSDLFAHIRMIYLKKKQRDTILKEFRESVIKSIGNSKKLIDEVLVPYADAYCIIRNATYKSAEGAEQVNRLLLWLDRIDNFDWVPPAITYFAIHKTEPRALGRFLTDLERLAACLMIRRLGINERIERYGKVLEAIEAGTDLYAESSPLQLSEEERKEFVSELDGEIYRQVPKRRLYVLLRLDSALSDGSATYDYSVISIEHVLPQTPPKDSQWWKWFPTSEVQDKYVHRLGNLLLLNQKKNSSASNLDFETKKVAYFAKGGVSPFVVTTQVIGEKEWTQAVVGQRQTNTVAKLREVWRL